MFGNRNRLSSDEIKSMKAFADESNAFFHKMANAKEYLDANVAEIKDSRRQVEQEITQVNDNVSTEMGYVSDNINIEASMIFETENIVSQMRLSNQDVDSLKAGITKLHEKTIEIVDSNKHYTTPSKVLQDLPADILEQNKRYQEQLGYMAEYSKQMGVLALNAAIEAGRMGKNGMQFVESAEQIRLYVANYNNSIDVFKNYIAESNDKVAKLEEQIKHLISLLKDNNVASGKLMKQCEDLERAANSISYDDYVNRIDSVRTELVGVKNIDEEILKTEERNRMQISDMEAEFEAQLKNEDEFLDTIAPFFETAIEKANETSVEVEEL